MKIDDEQYKTIWNENGTIKIIDQTKLPHHFVIKELNSVNDAVNAIKNILQSFEKGLQDAR
mgnify:CR=1 FL=1